MKKTYYLFVKNKKIEVNKDMYLAFHQLICAQKYNERCYRRHAHSLGNLPDARPGVEDTAVKNIMIEKLYDALKQLSEEEYALIFELFFNGRSERGLAGEWDMHPMTIHRQKAKIIEKLKKSMLK